MRTHPKTQSSKRSKGAMLVVVSLVAITASGCSKSLPTGPTVDHEAMAVSEGGSVAAKPAASAASVTWSWYQVASQAVSKGAAATVSGGRSKLQLVRGALGAAATITLMERDPLVPDVMVGPNGMVLSKASTLTVSYAGSALEGTPTLVKLFRFNAGTGSWEVVAATNDFANKTMTAKVTVLSRYAVCTGDPTKAGW